jgi:exportin-1
VSADEQNQAKNKFYMGKLNMVLVQILKQDWPHNWPQFIPEIVASSKQNLSLYVARSLTRIAAKTICLF